MSQPKSFLDHLSSPLTILPLGVGFSLLIVSWVVPQYRNMLAFPGAACVLVGFGIFMTKWLFSGGDPRLTQMQKEFLAALDAACRLDKQTVPQATKNASTPAAAASA